MLNKLKKLLAPLMLGAMIFGGAADYAQVVEPVEVYAATAPTGSIPNITMGTDGPGVDTLAGDGTVIYDKALTEFRTVVIFVSGIGTVCMILFFILNFINLGKSQGNPQERQKAISGLIISGIATAGLGSVTLIASLFYGMIK